MKPTYTAFAAQFLTTSHLAEKFPDFYALASCIDLEYLSRIISIDLKSGLDRESCLWLLAHLITIHRARKQHVNDSSYIGALSGLLSQCASDLVGKLDSDISAAQKTEDDEESLQSAVPLPTFIRSELVTLVNRDSVNGILASFNGSANQSTPTCDTSGNSSLVSYALILLRIFPRLGEEIRMWLYQGSVTVSGSTTALPALKLFWGIMSSTRTFKSIVYDSKAALNILQKETKSQGKSIRTADGAVSSGEWKSILLFLELYAFVLRFTDDEEFLNGGSQYMLDNDQSLSRSRASALPLQQVKNLTVFLKNFCFTMFYEAGELMSSDATSSGGLGQYFGASIDDKAATEVSTSPDSRSQSFLGIPGMSFLYVRGIATRVLRMLYDRDSRRPFLPKDHWLMTSRFDMEGFIPAVVAEEERRHQVTEDVDDEDAGNGDEEPYEVALLGRGVIGNNSARRHIHMESLRRQQQKIARRRMLASIGPKLEILQNMPFVIPFATRVQIFRQFVMQDQIRRRGGTVDPDHWRMTVMHNQSRSQATDVLSRHHAKIRRDNLFEDAYDQFFTLGEGLKEPIQITFVDQFDTPEAGIDGGGVTKEFLTSVTKEAFSTNNELSNLFTVNSQNLLYPNPEAIDLRKELLLESGLSESDLECRDNLEDLLRHYEFLGRVIGKCLYEDILVDINFAGFFLLKWANSGSTAQDTGYLANINDLRDLDEELYKGLLTLKSYPGNVEDFSTDFTIIDTVSLPGGPTKTIVRDLLPNGANMTVTNENRMLYVSLVARHRLHRQPLYQTKAFLRGLGQIITPTWLSMFNQAEIQTLIGGDSSEIDVDDLRRNTQYSGIYQIGDDGLEHPTVQSFWRVMKELDDSDRRKVLKYVTSTPRAPLLGFSQLNPRFSIRDSGSDEQRLPSTSTCINLMKLPRYSSPQILKEKLLYAVNSGAGFDLS